LFEKRGYAADTRFPSLPGTLADELLKVHRSYLKPIMALHDLKLLKGAAHITGGGLTDNVPRVLPKDCAVEVDPASWPKQPIFELLRDLGAVPEDDFRRTFNLGIGMVLVVSAKKLKEVSRVLKKLRESFYRIGQVIARSKSQRGSRVIYL
jgi:phosphoribosylformylglycinamidine cyclo-ligase